MRFKAGKYPQIFNLGFRQSFPEKSKEGATICKPKPTMLKLFLIRHGEAESAKAGQSDHARPLTARGKSDISALGSKLFSPRSAPFHIVCSSAVRTVSTATLIGGGAAIHQEDDLYNGNPDTYLHVIRRHSSAEQLVLVGHNPVISWLSAELSGGRSGAFMPGTCAELIYDQHVTDPAAATPVSVFIHHPMH